MTSTQRRRSLLLSPVVPALLISTTVGTLAYLANPIPSTPDTVPAVVATEMLKVVEPTLMPPKASEPQTTVSMADVSVPQSVEPDQVVDLTPELEAKVAHGSARHEVAVYVSRTFRIPMREARQVTDWAVEIGESRNLDPLLILAVIGTESSFKPQARSKVGAEGLMQVMTSVHAEKFEPFGGPEAAFDPYANMVVGTDILAYLIRRTGSIQRALKWYSGAANLPNDRGYGARVLREHGLLCVAAEGQSDKAVKLHRAGKKAPEAPAVGVQQMTFTRWVKLSEKAVARTHAHTLGMMPRA